MKMTLVTAARVGNEMYAKTQNSNMNKVGEESNLVLMVGRPSDLWASVMTLRR